HAGQLLVLGRDQPDGAGPADDHGNQPGFTDEGLEQVADRLAGHQPSPPNMATNRMPRAGQPLASRGPASGRLQQPGRPSASTGVGHSERRDSGSDIRTSAGLTVTGQTRTISGEERAFFSAIVASSLK